MKVAIFKVIVRLLVAYHPYSSMETAFRANTARKRTDSKSVCLSSSVHTVTRPRVGGENVAVSFAARPRRTVLPLCVSLVTIWCCIWPQLSSKCLKTMRISRVVRSQCSSGLRETLTGTQSKSNLNKAGDMVQLVPKSGQFIKSSTPPPACKDTNNTCKSD